MVETYSYMPSHQLHQRSQEHRVAEVAKPAKYTRSSSSNVPGYTMPYIQEQCTEF